MQRAIITSIQEEQSEQTLQLATHIFPTSLDPRITLLPTTNYIFKLLFEGLVDLDSEGNIQNKVAESYTLSPDGTQYTFSLRESYWNNGDLVTAYDFEYSWKKILSPSFEFPFSYLFYLIKNASEAKNGKAPLSSVGIEVIDPKTLVVTLKEPAPHFLHYLTLTIFLPVNRRIDQQHPDWSFHTNGEYVCNGPFTLGKVVMGKDLLLVKNELHWNHFHVRLSKINLTFIPSNEILKQFQKNEIHLLGAPFIPWEKRFFQCKEQIDTLSSTSLSWIIINTESGPLRNKKFRKALQYALNLDELVQQLPIDAEPAYGPLPPIYSCIEQNEGQGSQEIARQLFKEALDEMQMSESELSLTLIQAHQTFDIRKQFLKKMQQQIKNVLGIQLHIEVIPWKDAYKKTAQGNFQLFLISWKFLCNTPFYFLDLFESPTRPNVYHWTSASYREALHLARIESDPVLQKQKIADLERILIDEVPVIPLYSENERYIKSKQLENLVIDQSIGSFDFSQAYLKPAPLDEKQLVKWL